MPAPRNTASLPRRCAASTASAKSARRPGRNLHVHRLRRHRRQRQDDALERARYETRPPRPCRDARAELFLNLAREAQQLDEVVRPALARGEICITDRSLYSQIALSAGGRELD